MDFFAHGFWGYILFHWIRKPIYAVIFALLPDTVSWVPYFFYRMFLGVDTGRPMLEQIPNWTWTMYGIGHSLIISLSVILLIYIIFKTVPAYMFAWPISIMIDIPTHTAEFLPTPFLWPISDYAFNGISWGSAGFMIINWLLIIILLAVIIIKKNNLFKPKEDNKKNGRKSRKKAR